MATYEERLASMKAQRQDNGGVKGLYHANINVLDRNTLEDAMEHPENYPKPHGSRLRLRRQLRQADPGATA